MREVGTIVRWGATISPSALFQVVEEPKKRHGVMAQKCKRFDTETDSHVFLQQHQMLDYNESVSVLWWERSNSLKVRVNGEWHDEDLLSRGQRRQLSRGQLRAIKKHKVNSLV